MVTCLSTYCDLIHCLADIHDNVNGNVHAHEFLYHDWFVLNSKKSFLSKKEEKQMVCSIWFHSLFIHRVYYLLHDFIQTKYDKIVRLWWSNSLHLYITSLHIHNNNYIYNNPLGSCNLTVMFWRYLIGFKKTNHAQVYLVHPLLHPFCFKSRSYCFQKLAIQDIYDEVWMDANVVCYCWYSNSFYKNFWTLCLEYI